MVELGDFSDVAQHYLDGQMALPDFARCSVLNETFTRKVIIAQMVVPDLARDTDPDTAHEVRQAFETLVRADREAPSQSRGVFEQPLLGTWAIDCVRMQRRNPELYAKHLRYLGGYAAVAAIRARQDFCLSIPTNDYGIMLPGIGQIQLDTASPFVTVSGREGEVIIDNTVSLDDLRDNQSERWQPSRELTASAGGLDIALHFEDLDPARDRFGIHPAGRVSPERFTQWHEVFQDGWALLVAQVPEYANEIATGMRVVIPLADETPGQSRSATNSSAYGAVGMTFPPNATQAGLSLVHEFSHSRLNALNNMKRLYDANDDRLFYAPWRDDPRPPYGLMHGVFAHYDVVKFWRTNRHFAADTTQRQVAELEFARWREEVERTAELLEGSGFLNEYGQRRLAEMKKDVSAWSNDDISPEARWFARFGAADHKVSWQLSNLQPEEGAIDYLCQLWEQCRPAPTQCIIPSRIVATSDGLSHVGQHSRRTLLGKRIAIPRVFEKLCANASALSEHLPGATIADALIIKGDIRAARAHYLALIAADPTNVQPWSGLAMTFFGEPNSPKAQALLTQPEVVAHLHEQLQGRATPLDLADWLGVSMLGQ